MEGILVNAVEMRIYIILYLLLAFAFFYNFVFQLLLKGKKVKKNVLKILYLPSFLFLVGILSVVCYSQFLYGKKAVWHNLANIFFVLFLSTFFVILFLWFIKSLGGESVFYKLQNPKKEILDKIIHDGYHLHPSLFIIFLAIIIILIFWWTETSLILKAVLIIASLVLIIYFFFKTIIAKTKEERRE